MATFIYPATSNDLYGSSADGLLDTDTQLWLHGSTSISAYSRTWIPFTVSDVGSGVIIASATIAWYATATRSEVIDIYLGCENADNPSKPTDVTNLFSRVQTTAKLRSSLGSYTTGVQYSYDITSSVQEVINRSGWARGNTLAFLAVAVGTESANNRRLIASYENATYQEPILTIVSNSFVPTIIEG